MFVTFSRDSESLNNPPRTTRTGKYLVLVFSESNDIGIACFPFSRFDAAVAGDDGVDFGAHFVICQRFEFWEVLMAGQKSELAP